tara:strand:- start:169 stop:354 length:186 start_codon:yes stop_codon:yes gene_type:complete
MEAFSKLFKSKGRKAIEPFIECILNAYYNSADYGNQTGELSREDSFERWWNRARAILLKRK